MLFGAPGPHISLSTSGVAFVSDYGTTASGILGRGVFIGSSNQPRSVALIGAPVIGGPSGLLLSGITDERLFGESDPYFLATLSGADASFHPLHTEQGAWYGGGQTRTLDQLTDHESLPYRYDALFTP